MFVGVSNNLTRTKTTSMVDPAPAKATEGRNRAPKRSNRGGNAVAQAFYEVQPSISENMEMDQEGV